MNTPITPMPIAKPKAKTRKAVIIPLTIAALTAWFDYRLKSEKQLAEAGYAATTPALKEIQSQVTTLGNQVQLLQQLVLVMSQERETVRHLEHPRHNSGGLGGVVGGVVGSASDDSIEIKIDSGPALAKFKHDLVVNVTKSQGKPMMQQQLPDRLEDLKAK